MLFHGFSEIQNHPHRSQKQPPGPPAPLPSGAAVAWTAEVAVAGEALDGQIVLGMLYHFQWMGFRENQWEHFMDLGWEYFNMLLWIMGIQWGYNDDI